MKISLFIVYLELFSCFIQRRGHAETLSTWHFCSDYGGGEGYIWWRKAYTVHIMIFGDMALAWK